LKVALIADIHGNSIALKNVLTDIQSLGGVDEYWFLGDYAAIGYDPVGVLELISKISSPKRLIKGNTDRYLLTGELPWPKFADVEKDPLLVQLHIRVAQSFAWTTGAVGATGWLSWFNQLTLEMRTELPDGTKALLVHAAPGTDDGLGINISTTDEELIELVSDAGAELVIVGHTHIPFDRKVPGVRVINPGSISNPFPPDLRASYAIIDADKKGFRINHRRVDYDRETVVEATRARNHPAAEYIRRFMQGEIRKDWSK